MKKYLVVESSQINMKIDRLQIRLIIGLIFVIVIGIIIFFLDLKESNEKNTTKEKIYLEKNQINFIDLDIR